MAQDQIGYAECCEREEGHSARPVWTIMIYLAGDNSLSANAIAILQQLEAAKHDHNVRVIAGFDTSTPWPNGARYVEIKRHLKSSPVMRWALHNDLVQPRHLVVAPDFCNPLTTAPQPTEPIAKEGLARFLRWAKRYYAADKYMLILFGHGTVVASNTFLSDTTPPSYLKLKDLRRILKEDFGPKINILAFDNCVMNGIETAVELRKEVDYTIGSQGLVLTVGWPYRKIINVMVDHYRRLSPGELSEKVLRVCARNILDFSLMERSSEQAIIDVRQFHCGSNIVGKVKELSQKLQEGLSFDGVHLRYPIVRDAVRLARLEAQSFWSETFVDLYDFCALLSARCMELKCMLDDEESRCKLKDIAHCCEAILYIFRHEGIVPRAYYVGSELQYSHGVSVYFPWTLAQYPIIFEPVPNEGGGYDEPKNYKLKTPFEEYKEYDFAKGDMGDWAGFLQAFFRATLRNVRVAEYEHKNLSDPFELDITERDRYKSSELLVPVVDLQKSTSSTGDEDECNCPQIKNYPRRFYLSPADCRRRIHVPNLPGANPAQNEQLAEYGKVSYLGWNIRGLVAEEIGLPRGAQQSSEVEGPQTDTSE